MIQFRLPAPPARPLPVIATIRRAYELLWDNRRIELRLMLAPFVLLAVAMALQTRIVGGAETVQDMMSAIDQAPPGLMFAWFATMALGAALLISFSVSWRRFLLLKEPPSAFYFQRPFWRYLGFTTAFYMGLTLALVLTALLIIVLIYLSGLQDHHVLLEIVFSSEMLALALFIGWIVRYIVLFNKISVKGGKIQVFLIWAIIMLLVLLVLKIVIEAFALIVGLDLLKLFITCTLILTLLAFVGWIVRYILLFTAITVDNRGLTWHGAAEAMQGNVLRYCLVWAGTIAPVLLASNLIAYALAFAGLDLLSIPGAIAFALVQSLVSVLQIGLGASLGALIYDFLLRGGGPRKD